MTNPLDPLLRARSLALVGASPKPGSYGQGMIRASLDAGFEGRVYFVNPGYDEIEGRPCYPSLADLPEVPEHAVLMIANSRIEQILAEAIAKGVKAATIFASLQLDDGNPVPLAERVMRMATEAGMLICGGNGSGFYNRVHKLRCRMGAREAEEPGPVTLISQSGSLGAAVEDNDGRLRFNITVSSGQELTTDASDYMHFALDEPSTKAIGLCIETIRKPGNFVAALARAQEMDIPVVMLKVAKSEQGKRFAVSHSGALAGDSAVYEAVMRRYGGLCVDDLDEMVATLQLLTTGRRATTNEIVAITDSGGERELLADVASETGIGFTQITETTRQRLSEIVEYGLDAENPLDAWGTGHGYQQIFGNSIETLLQDPGAGMGIWVADLRERLGYYCGFAEAAMDVATRTSKPLAFATCYSKGYNENLAQRLAAAGVPVLEGIRPAMVATRHMLAFSTRKPEPVGATSAALPDEMLSRWRTRLAQPEPLGESEGLALLADFGIPVARHARASTLEETQRAAEEIGYPVVLKSAQPGLLHKSDQGGVVLGLKDQDALTQAYERMQRVLGPEVLIAAEVAPGVEFTLGFFQDPQFGPMMLIGAGGVLVEILRDTAVAVPPIGPNGARDLIEGLQMRPLLDGYRGSEPCDIGALIETVQRFSELAHSLGDLLGEADVNPLIVSAGGVVAVDALFVPRATQSQLGKVEHV